MTTKQVVANDGLNKVFRRCHDLQRRVMQGTLDANMVATKLQRIIEGEPPVMVQDLIAVRQYFELLCTPIDELCKKLPSKRGFTPFLEYCSHVGDLVFMFTRDRLSKVKGVGEGTIDLLEQKLLEMGVVFGKEVVILPDFLYSSRKLSEWGARIMEMTFCQALDEIYAHSVIKKVLELTEVKCGRRRRWDFSEEYVPMTLEECLQFDGHHQADLPYGTQRFTWHCFVVFSRSLKEAIR